MSKTKIEWADRRWNPATGCEHTPEQCAVYDSCYARRLANRLKGRFGYDQDEPFKPTFHADRLDEPIKIRKPQTFFVCTMGDLFGEWVPREWILKVLEVVKQCPQHTFLFLTKNPRRYAEFEFPKNAWLGTTITSESDSYRIRQLTSIKNDNLKFLSIEPLLKSIVSGFVGIDWIIVGGLSPNPVHNNGAVMWLIKKCEEKRIPIFLKSNLNYPDKIEEFPEVSP